MSRTLDLVDSMLAQARRFYLLGLHVQAAPLLDKLLRLHPTEKAAEEAQAMLGEIRLHQQQFDRARRHLTVAANLAPAHAPHHHRLAQAAASDPACDPNRALPHYRRTLSLEPEDARCWCEYALQALKVGKTAVAWKALDKALQLAPDDAEVVEAAAEAFREHGKEAAATRLLRLARFRNSGDPQFHRMWQNHQFRLLHARQNARFTTDLDDEPRLLPFVRPEEAPQAENAPVRTDGPSTLPGPHRPIRSRRKPGPRSVGK